jgi:hypothetical protein
MDPCPWRSSLENDPTAVADSSSGFAAALPTPAAERKMAQQACN